MNPLFTIFLALCGVAGIALACRWMWAMTARVSNTVKTVTPIAGIEPTEGSVCPDCLMWVEPGMCWCGYLVASHGPEHGHAGVAWGCQCGKHKQERSN